MSWCRMSARFVQILVMTIVGLALVTPGIFADPPSSPSNETSTPAATVAKPEIVNSLGMKLVLIRAGNFRMGSPDSDKDARADEKPQHRVRIKNPFYLGKFEVTRGEFRKFVTATKYRTDAEKDGQGGWGISDKNGGEYAHKPEFTWRNAGFEQTDEHPVVNVSWNDAVAFCQWLSKTEGKTYRLPTEAEWEWSCRAGAIERWNCGDKEEDLKGSANVADASLKAKWAAANWAMNWDDGSPFTSVVGKYKANKFGLHDMHGNVREWCSDWYDAEYYARLPITDPQGPETGSLRVYRGGSWLDRPVNCRSARRDSDSPSHRTSYLGFRLALSTKE